MPRRNKRQQYLVGWDVGGWNCDRNSKSRDALVVVDKQGKPLGQPWRGNLRAVVNRATDGEAFSSEILKLCKIEADEDRETILAIDAPLAFSDAFRALVARGAVCPVEVSLYKNEYLYRYCERRLAADEIRPLSSVKDMIGSQATKAIHVRAKFAPKVLSCGVFANDQALRIIETYPAACRKRAPSFWGEEAKAKLTAKKKDIADARVCALMAQLFATSSKKLEGPDKDAPPDEGWIWVPKRIV